MSPDNDDRPDPGTGAGRQSDHPASRVAEVTDSVRSRADVIEIDLRRCEEATPVRAAPRAYSVGGGYSDPPRRRRRWWRSIKRNGANEEYQAQDLPFAGFPSKPGVAYRAGTEVGGQRCPRCPTYIAVTSRVVRLARPERGKWWVHERCWSRKVSR